MSITWGVLAQSPEPETRDKVLDNNAYQYQIGISENLFLGREENVNTLKKPLRARTRTNNNLGPHMTPSLGIEPRFPKRFHVVPFVFFAGMSYIIMGIMLKSRCFIL